MKGKIVESTGSFGYFNLEKIDLSFYIHPQKCLSLMTNDMYDLSLFSKARFCTYDQLDYENVKIQQLKRRSDITITKPDKGSGVVLMDRAEYVRLLHDASIKDYLNLFLSVKRNPNEKDALPNTITQVTGKGTTTLVSSAENTSQIYCRQDIRQWLTLSPSILSAQDPQGRCLCVLYYLPRVLVTAQLPNGLRRS